MSHADCHSNRCCGWVGLLNEEGFLLNYRLFSWRHWRLGLGLRGEAGQLACQSGQLSQRVIHHIFLLVVILVWGMASIDRSSLIVIVFLA